VNHDLSQVQIGDFGLACCLQHSSEDVTLMMQPSSEYPPKHKGEIGTKLYAAPEQLRGKCDSKVSYFSSCWKIKCHMRLAIMRPIQEC
jgi:serine/threonine protein kinase